MDYRSRFIQDLETALTGIFDPGQVAIISRTAVKALQPYELTERCTALAPLDDYNEKTLKRYRACLIINGKSEKTIGQYLRTCEKLADLLHKPYLDSKPESGTALFFNKDHKPLQDGGVRKMVARIGSRAGASNVHPHRFRRTFATGLARRGMNIQEVQKLLGHSGVNTTMKYVNVSDEKVMASYQQYIA